MARYRYKAVFSRQRGSDGPLVASFAAPAGELKEWAVVQRISYHGKGHQRLKNKGKINAIRRFLEHGEKNTIPTALVVALNIPGSLDHKSGECGELVIPDQTDGAPGLVIDGQHRMYGVAAADPAFPLNIVALINPEDEEIAFQFLVINSKASKVPTDHVKFLALQYSDDALADRLTSARMVLGRYAWVGVVDSSRESPFFGSVIWPTDARGDEDRKRLVRPAAIEQALAAVAKKRLPDLEDDDSLLDFFFTVWSTVKDKWPDLWSPQSKLLQKVGVVTFTTFVIEDLVPLADRGDIDLADPDAVRKEVENNILAWLDPGFWQSEWSAKSLDTSAGRQLVVEALTTVRRNMRRDVAWDRHVSLIANKE